MKAAIGGLKRRCKHFKKHVMGRRTSALEILKVADSGLPSQNSLMLGRNSKELPGQPTGTDLKLVEQLQGLEVGVFFRRGDCWCRKRG